MFRKTNKPLSILVALLLVIQVLVVDLPVTTNAQSTLGNIFTFDSMKIGGQDVNEGDIIEVMAGTQASLAFKWDTHGIDVKAGDTAHMVLPEAFNTMVPETRQSVIVDGDNVGEFWIEDGVLWIEFNEKAAEDNIENGTVNMDFEFNMEKFTTNVKQEIVFNDKDNNTLEVIAKPIVNTEDITKIGTAILKDGETVGKHDSQYIDWVIDVVNNADQVITDGKIKDNLPEGLELDLESFKLEKLAVGYNGLKTVQGTVDTVNVDYDDTTVDFTVSLDAMEPYEGYRLTYRTKITDISKETFTNDVNFTYDDKSLPADSTVSGLTRSSSIEKTGYQTGYNQGEQEVRWQIDVNKSGNTFDEAIVKDTLPAGHSIVVGSIKVVKITRSGSNWNEGAAHPGTFTGFPMNLGALDEDDAYRIYFDTEVDWSLVNEGIYEVSNGFVNTTELFDGENKVDEDSATVTIYRSNIISKGGTASVGYDGKTLNWTITLNQAKHDLGSIVVTDILPKGVTLVESSIQVKNQNNVVVTPDSKTVTALTGDDAGKTELKLGFNNVTKDDILTITYQTTLNEAENANFNQGSFKNGVGVTGDGIGPDGENSSHTQYPAGNTYNKTSPAVDYGNKTVSFTLSVQPKREALKSLEIKDIFPSKGLILLPDTMEVKVGTTVLEKGVDYILAPNTEDDVTGYQKGFILTFPSITEENPLNADLTITYKTSFDPQMVVEGKVPDLHVPVPNQDVRRYFNRAVFTSTTIHNNTVTETRDAGLNLREDAYNRGYKDGRLVHLNDANEVLSGWVSGRERLIEWGVFINYLQQDLGTNVVLTDTLSYPGEVDVNSVVIYKYTVNAAGVATITNEVLDASKYVASVDPDNPTVLTVSFNEAVKERYVIRFLSKVPELSLNQYVNNASLKVGEKTYPYTKSINYTEYDSYVAKKATNVTGTQVYTGDVIDWEVKLNTSLSIVNNPVITDTISDGHVYINNGFKVYKVVDGVDVELEEGEDKDYTLIITPRSTEGVDSNFEIRLKGILTTIVKVKYQTVVTETNGTISNTVLLNGTGVQEELKEESRMTARQFSSVSGEWSRATRGILELSKMDLDTDTLITNNPAEFTLWYKLNDSLVQFGNVVYKTNSQGILTIEGLPIRTYYLLEVTAPEGYKAVDSEAIEANMTAVNVVAATSTTNPIKSTVTITNERERIDITGTKTWVNGPTVKPDIQLQLHKDGVAEGLPVTLSNGKTTYTWTDLFKTNIEGVDHVYTVKEVGTPDNYSKQESGLTATNTYVIPKIELTATKQWVNGPSVKPTIELQLYRNLTGSTTKQTVGTAVTLTNGTTSHTWTNLDKTDINGVVYQYSVDEVNVPDNYDKTVVDLTITNTYVIPKTTFTGTKVWNGGLKPEIELQLLQDGVAHGTPVILEEGVLSYTWTDLDATDFDGHVYTYTFEEVDVPDNYEMTVSDDGLTITNTYVIPKVDVVARKVWVGGIPVDIELQLFRDGQPMGEVVILSKDETSYSWTDLDATDFDGNPYVYSVDEVNVPDNFDKTHEDDYTIINTYVIPQIDVTGTKVWVGGLKPTIELQLFRDGEVYGAPVVLEQGELSYTWTGLDATDFDGNVYTYTIDEVAVPEYYEKTISEDGLTITNTYVIPLIDITGSKLWIGGPKADIQLQLYRNGLPFESAITLKKGTNSYTWEGLDATDEDGVSYVYTVDEVTVPEGYEKSISEDGLTITNMYTREILPSTGMGNEVKYAGYGMVMLGLAFTLLKKRRKEEE